MKKLFLFSIIFAHTAYAQERVAVKQQSQEETVISELLEKIKYAIDNEDYVAYSKCLTKELISKNKKFMILFLEKDLGLEIEKFFIIDSDENEIEFFIKYKLYSENNTENIISNFFAKKVDGQFLLSKENIISKKQNSNNDKFAENCPDGNCPIPQNNLFAKPEKRKLDPDIEFDEKGRQILKGVSMFNDANGNPDPNGIMWIDPKVLLRKFPEKYGVPKCVNGECKIR